MQCGEAWFRLVNWLPCRWLFDSARVHNNQTLKKMRKKKVIQVPPGAVQLIMRAHRCSKTAVYDALSWKTNSEFASKIRQDALAEYGGVEVTKVYFSS